MMAVTQRSWPTEANEHADQRVYLHGVPWSHYEIMLAVKGDAPVPRIAYLEGEPVGSWTVHSASAQRGVEPDECYTVGDPRAKRVPDLAIEVIWTRGGLDKLEIYRGLGVGEVWFWREGRIDVYVLREGAYHPSSVRVIVPGLDLQLVARLATASPAVALAELRKSWA